MTAIALLMSFHAYALPAPTTLKIPISYVYQSPGGDEVFLNAPQIREALTKNGREVPEFDDYYVASAADDFHRAYHFKTELEVKLQDAFKGIPALEDGDLWNGDYPTAADTPEFPTCYTGLPRDLAGIFQNTVGSFNTEQAVAQGLRYKKQKWYPRSGDDEETDAFLTEGSAAWANWTGQGTDVLVIFSTTDDGDDINEALIEKCK